jgi:DNA-binding transcriptional MerR regulator
VSSYSISQVAERTGFSPSTLRFYEQHGLVRPDRTPSGYRAYGDHDLERIGFIGRAKGFGLSLDEITELLALFEQDRCAPVQERLQALVAEKIAEARARVAELQMFTSELRKVAAALDVPAPDGPCDDTCGCTVDVAAPESVPLGECRSDDAIPIACSLSSAGMAQRIADWRAVLDEAEGREPITSGVRLRFGRGVDVAEVAALADAEQQCCQFFEFTLTVSDGFVTLDVTAPADAQAVLDDLLGGPV